MKTETQVRLILRHSKPLPETWESSLLAQEEKNKNSELGKRRFFQVYGPKGQKLGIIQLGGPSRDETAELFESLGMEEIGGLDA
jgi:hypothetical protein